MSVLNEIYKNLLGGITNKRWNELIHNGPMFPKLYEKKNIPIIINNKKYILPDLAEEYAMMYSKYIGTEYVENKNFNKNFWADFKHTLPNDILKLITDITNIDFSQMVNYHIIKKTEEQNMTPQQKKERKAFNDALEEPYKYCVINNMKQTVGNFKIEPPGIFLGRGKHPKLGKIKKRIFPEDVTINISKNAKIPIPNIKGHTWGDVIHDNSVVWLSTWKDNISGKNKYIFTNFESMFKSESDENKFNLAKKLKKKVKHIREEYMSNAKSSDIKLRQLATSLYLIDNLALRVGNTKDKKKSADTVGVSTLRIEHIKLIDNNEIKLDFLGKDCVRFIKKIKIEPIIYDNLKLFISNKNDSDKVFDAITPTIINNYLNNFIENLTSKVWRTYNASEAFQKSLKKIDNKVLDNMNETSKINYLISIVNNANAASAVVCNHQKKVTSSSKGAIEKIKEQIKKLKSKKQTEDIKNKIKILKLKKENKDNTKDISLVTSRDNYIDPRIIFSFMKKYNIPFEKFFNKKSLDRFKWASEIDENYTF